MIRTENGVLELNGIKSDLMADLSVIMDGMVTSEVISMDELMMVVDNVKTTIELGGVDGILERVSADVLEHLNELPDDYFGDMTKDEVRALLNKFVPEGKSALKDVRMSNLEAIKLAQISNMFK